MKTFVIVALSFLSISLFAQKTNAPGSVPGKITHMVHQNSRELTNILIYSDDNGHTAPNTYVDQALQNLGLSYTAYYDGDISGFTTALTGGTWDLVIFNDENYSGSSSDLDALDAYLNNGGKLIVGCWWVDNSSSHPLWQDMGISSFSDNYGPVDPIYWWAPSHPIFNSPQSVPELTGPTYWFYGVSGQNMEPLAGFEAIAGWTTPGPDAEQAAIIIGNDNRSIMKGFLDGELYQDLDTDGTPDGVELWMNMITFIYEPVSVPVSGWSLMIGVSLIAVAMAFRFWKINRI